VFNLNWEKGGVIPKETQEFVSIEKNRIKKRYGGCAG